MNKQADYSIAYYILLGISPFSNAFRVAYGARDVSFYLSLLFGEQQE